MKDFTEISIIIESETELLDLLDVIEGFKSEFSYLPESTETILEELKKKANESKIA